MQVDECKSNTHSALSSVLFSPNSTEENIWLLSSVSIRAVPLYAKILSGTQLINHSLTKKTPLCDFT